MGSNIQDLVRMLLVVPSIKVVSICLVTYQASCQFDEVMILNQYLMDVSEGMHDIFCWRLEGFSQLTLYMFFPDGAILLAEPIQFLLLSLFRYYLDNNMFKI